MVTISQTKYYTKTDIIAIHAMTQNGLTLSESLDKINQRTEEQIENNRLLSKVILAEIMKFYEFTEDQMKSTSRRSDLVKARAFYALFAYELTPLSYKQIGRNVNRKHSAIIHIIGRIKSDIGLGYPDVLDDYNKLKEILRNVNIATDGI